MSREQEEDKEEAVVVVAVLVYCSGQRVRGREGESERQR